jgi:hypothetical protein
VLLFLISTIALAIRYYKLDLAPLIPDESFSWRLTQYPSADLIQRTAVDVHPPLYYLALKVWESICGDALQSVRGFSAICGVLGILALYNLCIESGREQGSGIDRKGIARNGALFACFIMTIHLAQVAPSRTARMYSLGVLLAGLTASLLLRALRAKRNRVLWWLAYGSTSAAFCYTHNYAFFTICAQGLFAAGDLLHRARTESVRQIVPQAAGLACAAILAGLLYTPWLPILDRQVHAVRQNYWIPTVTSRDVEQILISWLSGMDSANRVEGIVWTAPLVFLVIWRLARRDRIVIFFFLQAILPWTAGLSLSVWSGRSIFLERYLAFAHLSILGLWSVIWCRLPGTYSRLLCASWISFPSLLGLHSYLEQTPVDSPAIVNAASALKQQYKPGDLICVHSPAAVNQIRYYTKQAGLHGIDVCCYVSPFEDDKHMSHIAALSEPEIQWLQDANQRRAKRVWLGSHLSDPVNFAAKAMAIHETLRFRNTQGDQYLLRLYE